MKILHKAIPLELKSLEEDGTFSGYGSVFNVVDKGRDIVVPGAFEQSLKSWAASGRSIPALWQHKPDEPIGHYPLVKEDDHGLFNDGELWLQDAPYARVAHRGMKSKAVTGMSIGYRVKREEYDKKSGNTRLLELDLVEISIVTNPMNDDARVADVKGMLESGELPSITEFERFLREAGFSKSQAAAVANNGLPKLYRGEPGGEKGDDILSLLNNFKLTL